jgi:hypothetical protein
MSKISACDARLSSVKKSHVNNAMSETKRSVFQNVKNVSGSKAKNEALLGSLSKNFGNSNLKGNTPFGGGLGDVLSASVKRESRIERDKREFLEKLERDKVNQSKSNMKGNG